MAWNTPGSDNGGSDNRPTRQRKPGGGGLDAIVDNLRGMFGGDGGGGNALRCLQARTLRLLNGDQGIATPIKFAKFSRNTAGPARHLF